MSQEIFSEGLPLSCVGPGGEPTISSPSHGGNPMFHGEEGKEGPVIVETDLIGTDLGKRR